MTSVLQPLVSLIRRDPRCACSLVDHRHKHAFPRGCNFWTTHSIHARTFAKAFSVPEKSIQDSLDISHFTSGRTYRQSLRIDITPTLRGAGRHLNAHRQSATRKPAVEIGKDAVEIAKSDEEEDKDSLLNDRTLTEKLDACRVWIGVDPDCSGAIAVLWEEEAFCGEKGLSAIERARPSMGQLQEVAGVRQAQVVDTPTMKVQVGKVFRTRHDAVQMLEKVKLLNLPESGCVAFVECPPLMPRNGAQSAMQSGYGFGVWVGLLTALGIEIYPVYPSVWKRASG
eukprot:CAMPEP_0198223714 /NCGR_PEP_ID=MMETSP1445-20131203/93700_1 /TAXON_ID=36898 /ORGANISM="Pyramimonas sp., Strain CCMP2087" /LENGTH=282 /DNA_ID=CAMNT_0043902639 /DNA_START=217 /DNA_END=1061 /DNA_ORIENTATION=+